MHCAHSYTWPWSYVDIVAKTLLVVGGLNWGLIGFYGINLVSRLFGYASDLTRVVYCLVGIAAVYTFYSQVLHAATDLCCVVALDGTESVPPTEAADPDTTTSETNPPAAE
eukprot:jgi/Bigna1/69847/fgenesh1_pg.10_\